MSELSRSEKHREATSKGMKRSAEQRRCPSCKRGAAIKRHGAGGIVVRVCRYCGFEKGYTQSASV